MTTADLPFSNPSLMTKQSALGQVLQLVERKLPTFDQEWLSDAVANYASVATKKRFMLWLDV